VAVAREQPATKTPAGRSHRPHVCSLLLLCILVLPLPAAGAPVELPGSAFADTKGPPARSSTELLVKFRPSHLRTIQASVDDTGFRSLDTLFQRHGVRGFRPVVSPPKGPRASSDLFAWYVISIDRGNATPSTPRAPGGEDVWRSSPLQALATSLRAHAAVASAEPNFVIRALRVPNDPYYASSGSWGQPYADMWGMRRISPERAWDETVGSLTAVTAVLDTGVDPTHPDLDGNLWVNAGETPGNGVDDDGNGFVDDHRGWDFIHEDNQPWDDHGHGTMTSGVVSAEGNNGIGVTGVTWAGPVMPLKILGPSGWGYIVDAIRALRYAGDMGARVASNSYGCKCHSAALDDAIHYAHERGVVVVGAAGNDGADVSAFAPAAAHDAIAVGATDPDDALATFSSRGARLDVAAPGVDILTTKNSTRYTGCGPEQVVGQEYCHLSGTSFAAPHVAGVAALLLAEYPGMTPEQVRQAIRIGAVDLGPTGPDATFGSGRIDVSASLALGDSVLGPYIESPRSRRVIRGTIEVHGGIVGQGFQRYELQVGSGDNPTSWTTLASSTVQVTAGRLATVDTTALSNGPKVLRLVAVGQDGRRYTFEVFGVRVDNVDPDVQQGFPVQVPADAGTYQAGPVIHTLVGGIDDDPQSEILVTALAGGPLYAFDHDGTLVKGWPPTDKLVGAAYAGLGQLVPSDGDLEVASGYFGSGSSRGDLAAYDDDATHLPGWPRQSTGYVGKPPSLADVDGDGTDEVFIDEESGHLHAYRADGTVLPGWPQYGDAGPRINTPAIGDLDGDEEFEVVAATGWVTSGMLLHAWHHDGTAVAGFPVRFMDSYEMTFPMLGDVDGDGQSEIVFSGLDGSSPVAFVVGANGSIERKIPLPGFTTRAGALADMNGDRVPEIIMQTSELVVVRGDGTPLAGWPRPAGAAFNAGPVVGDVDGDGSPDIAIVVEREGDDEVHLYDAAGRMHPRFPKYLPLLGPGAVPAIADIDGDARIELIVTGAHWSGESGDYDKVWVYDLRAPGPYGGVEWGQFGGDARHRHIYPITSPSSAIIRDTTPPVAPSLTDTDPDSPANDNTPEVKGSAEAGSTVTLYTNAVCTGSPATTGPAAEFASPGLTVPVPDNSTTILRATATDAAGNTSTCSPGLTYTEDSAAPTAPSVTDTDPDSPANDNTPEVKGSAETGSTVRLYTNAACSGSPAAVGTAATFASPGLTVPVADNSTTTFRATATDAAGNTSACSEGLSYTEESSVPPPPTEPTPSPDGSTLESPPEPRTEKIPVLKAKPRRVEEPGNWVKLIARVDGLCVDDTIEFRRGSQKISTRVVGEDCLASIRRRITKPATFAAVLLPSTGHLGGTSNRVRVRVSG
jgi:subtilisin family serine protease